MSTVGSQTYRRTLIVRLLISSTYLFQPKQAKTLTICLILQVFQHTQIHKLYQRFNILTILDLATKHFVLEDLVDVAQHAHPH